MKNLIVLSFISQYVFGTSGRRPLRFIEKEIISVEFFVRFINNGISIKNTKIVINFLFN